MQPGGPADKAGLKPGDIITTVDGRSIKDGNDLVDEIASRRPGSTVRLGYMRDGKQDDTTVTIGDRDKVFADMGNNQAETNPGQPGRCGRDQTGPRRSRDFPGNRGQDSTPRAWSSNRFAPARSPICRVLEPGLVITRAQQAAHRHQRSSLTPSAKKLKTGDDVVFEVLDPKHPDQGINYVGGTLQ